MKGKICQNIKSPTANKKIDNLIKKVVFRCNSSFFTHLLQFFIEKTHMQKFYMETSTGRLRDPLAGRPGDQMMGRSGDVPGRRSYMFF